MPACRLSPAQIEAIGRADLTDCERRVYELFYLRLHSADKNAAEIHYSRSSVHRILKNLRAKIPPGLREID